MYVNIEYNIMLEPRWWRECGSIAVYAACVCLHARETATWQLIDAALLAAGAVGLGGGSGGASAGVAEWWFARQRDGTWRGRGSVKVAVGWYGGVREAPWRSRRRHCAHGDSHYTRIGDYIIARRVSSAHTAIRTDSAFWRRHGERAKLLPNNNNNKIICYFTYYNIIVVQQKLKYQYYVCCVGCAASFRKNRNRLKKFQLIYDKKKIHPNILSIHPLRVENIV